MTDISIDEFVRRMGEKRVIFAREGDGLRVSAPKNTLSAEEAAYIRDHKAALLEIVQGGVCSSAATNHGPQRLSFLQERFWSHQKMFPEMTLYNLASAWRLTGALDSDAFQRALTRVVERQEILRARFEEVDGAPVVTYERDVEALLVIEDLAANISDTDMLARLELLRDAPFALDAGETYRARLFRLTPNEHVFCFAPHHIIWDGLSWDVFVRDLSAYYAHETGGARADLPSLSLSFSEFAEKHRCWTESPELEQELETWRDYYAGDTSPLALPADCKRPKLFSYQGGAVNFSVEPDTIASVHELAARHRCTSYVVYLAAWQAFLYRFTGQNDIVVGSSATGRHEEGSADLLGCLGNVLGLRAKLDGEEPFSAFLKRARVNFLSVLERQKAPMEYLMQNLRGSLDLSRTALFQAAFTYQNSFERADTLGDLGLEPINISPAGAPTDIHLEILDGAERVDAAVNYSTDVMNEEGARHLASCFAVFIADVAAHPEKAIAEIEVMSAAERDKTLVSWNDTDTPYRRDALASDYLDIAAAKNPDAPAASMGDATLSYAQLQAQSNRIGNYLQSKGVVEGDIVAVYMDRSIDMVASILGVWKAGAALLPIDPGFPQSRLAYMLDDAKAKATITTTDRIEDWLLAAAPVIDIEAALDDVATMAATAPKIDRAAALTRAYVIYTSGSTGNPKGVENAHPALCNFLESMLREPGMKASDRMLAVTTISFDVMLLELFVTLAAGAEIILASNEEAMDGFALAETIEKRDITVLQGTPSTWRILFEAGWTGKPDLKALCGGEAMPASLADKLPAMVGELWNMYGPTETTVWSSCARIESADNIHAGRPIANTQIYILDDFGAPTPAGVAGDLWIGGDGVALGYLGKPELTAERFRDNPFGRAGRIYNTGDRARWRRDGTIEIMGRRDEQIKIRGYRIELGDIETALGKHPAVRQAAAALRKDNSGEPSLVGYVVFDEGQSATTSELRRFMRENVPHYMTPQFFIPLTALPLTNNNKVDRKALPAPAGVAARARRIAPRTQVEVALATIWSEILNTSDISVSDNFFELGGQSIHAARMIARARDTIGLKFSPREVIFESLEQLAADRAAA